jgi:1-acyl-sn-glycerol-3-phosphate acyltransferase
VWRSPDVTLRRAVHDRRTMSDERVLLRAHEWARERGVRGALYAAIRALLTPLLRLWFRLRIDGAEHIPAEGPVIVAPNHKSFLDAFFIALATRRHVRYMAKVELFRGPLGWLFLRLGAFPVRRGEADADALETARTILAQGGLLVIFPEGTRVDEADALGSPHHGAGRLAIESRAPIVPTAIAGTQHLWVGPVPKPRRVQLAFGAPIEPAEPGGSPAEPTDLVDNRVWPAVAEEYGRLRATPGLIAAGLTAVGVGALAARRARTPSKPRLLGKLEPRKLRRRRARRRLRERLSAATRLRR